MLFSKISSKNRIFYLFVKYINFNKINIKIKIKKCNFVIALDMLNLRIYGMLMHL